jgi:protocadherin Fat 4
VVVIFIEDVNDNPPVFDEKSYEVTLSENVTAGTRLIQVILAARSHPRM